MPEMHSPPTSAGTMLSGWPSTVVAMFKISCSDNGLPMCLLAPQRPANVAAALEPRPRAKGMRLTALILSVPGHLRAASNTRNAARTTRFDSSRGKTSNPSPSISTVRVSDRLELVQAPPLISIVTSLYSGRATPSTSNPGPRLALVAGILRWTRFINFVTRSYAGNPSWIR